MTSAAAARSLAALLAGNAISLFRNVLAAITARAPGTDAARAPWPRLRRGAGIEPSRDAARCLPRRPLLEGLGVAATLVVFADANTVLAVAVVARLARLPQLEGRDGGTKPA